MNVIEEYLLKVIIDCKIVILETDSPVLSGFLLGFGVSGVLEVPLGPHSCLEFLTSIFPCGSRPVAVKMSGFPASPRTGLLPVIHGTTLN